MTFLTGTLPQSLEVPSSVTTPGTDPEVNMDFYLALCVRSTDLVVTYPHTQCLGSLCVRSTDLQLSDPSRPVWGSLSRSPTCRRLPHLFLPSVVPVTRKVLSLLVFRRSSKDHLDNHQCPSLNLGSEDLYLSKCHSSRDSHLRDGRVPEDSVFFAFRPFSYRSDRSLVTRSIFSLYDDNGRFRNKQNPFFITRLTL